MNTRFKNIKNKLEKSFLQLLDKKNLKDITITEICDNAKVNRTTFYTHYFDINDLIKNIEKEKLEELSKTFDNDKAISIEDYLKNMFIYFNENKNFYKPFLSQFYGAEYLDVILPDKIFLSNKIVKGKKNVDYNLSFFKAGLTEIIKKWLLNDCKETPAQMNKLLKNIMITK